mgnify:CR=1 FL=1
MRAEKYGARFISTIFDFCEKHPEFAASKTSETTTDPPVINLTGKDVGASKKPIIQNSKKRSSPDDTDDFVSPFFGWASSLCFWY